MHSRLCLLSFLRVNLFWLRLVCVGAILLNKSIELHVMKKNQNAIVFVILHLLFLPGLQQFLPAGWRALGQSASLQAQEDKYSYKVYNDRKEGIVPAKTLVAGERLVLVSAGIESSESLSSGEPLEYKLAFYLHQGARRMSLTVRELKKRYKMEPLRREYPAGLNSFSWPAEIPRFYQISLQDLAPLAEISDSSGKKIVPVAIFSAAPKHAELNYRFCFIPLQAISILEYKIYPFGSLAPIYAATLRGINAEEEAPLRWHGKDRNNRMAGDGWYHIAVEATFKPLPGENARRVNLRHTFYHAAEILKGNWNAPR